MSRRTLRPKSLLTSYVCSFCRENAFGDYNTCLKSINCGVLKSFFTWRLDIKSGKGGRMLKGIKTVSSLGLHWKVFRLVYTRATGTKLDATLNDQMHQVHCPPQI